MKVKNQNPLRGIRERMGPVFKEFIEHFHEDLTNPAFLGALPKDSPMPVAVFDEPECSWVFVRVPANLRSRLNERERKVALCVARDLPNKAIGRMGTVKSILQTIFSKLGIHSRLKLAQLAVGLMVEGSNGPICT